MEVQKKNLTSGLEGAKNIYDVLVALYSLIDNEDSPGNIQRYYEESNADDWSEVNSLLDQLLSEQINFQNFMRKLLQLLEAEDLFMFAIHVLKFFDQIFKDKEAYPYLEFGNIVEVNCLRQLGPLNNEQTEYRLYLTAGTGLVEESKALIESKCRIINRKDGSDIFESITGYRIVRVLPKREPLIKIKEYGKNIFCSDEGEEKNLRLAIIPVSRKRWFHIKYEENTSGKHYFEIEDNKSKIKENNRAYLQLFDRMVDEKVEIAVFPELAMNSATEDEICEYLAHKALTTGDYSLKLVFLGSCWENGSNKCVLLSGNGSVLCRNGKKNPFSLVRNEKEYFEKLTKKPVGYEILDVKHLGRILYIVCKDGLDDIGQFSFWNEYGVNFEVISSFSPSIAFFEQEMADMISKYKGMALVANSCCPRKAEGRTAVGFVKLPYMRKKKPFLIDGLGKEYNMEEQCMKNCTFCSCMHIFDIKPDRLQENEILSGMKIDYTKICR